MTADALLCRNSTEKDLEMSILWKERYLIDDGMIDNDHRVLFGLINSIAEIDQKRFVIQQIKVHMGALKKYTIEHFAREEEFQRKIKFDLYEEHIMMHHEMIQKLDEIILDFRLRISCANFSYADICEGMFHLLQVWIVSHILKSDMKMIPYIAVARQRGWISDPQGPGPSVPGLARHGESAQSALRKSL
jgi:hemerythrin